MFSNKINISFIMYAGLSYGGAHRLAIRLACALDKEQFNIAYFWCKPNPDMDSAFVWPELDYSNITLMEEHGINVIEFHARTRDISNKYHPWIDSDFFEKYEAVKTDIVFTSRAGYPEYPFFLLREPIVEWNIFGCSDPSKNLVYSVATSQWTYDQWVKENVQIDNAIIYPGVPAPAQAESFRSEMSIDNETIVFGFHQRNDDFIYGEHALRAYAQSQDKIACKTQFLILGGSEKYKALAIELNVPVIFLPIAKDYVTVSRFLQTLDVFAHSGGAGEALAIVIQEAMMHGLPSITMTISGFAHGQVGTMAGSGIVTSSIEEYASAIQSLAGNAGLRAGLGAKAKSIALEKYSVESVATKFEKLFRTIQTRYSGRKFSRINRLSIDYFVESNPSLRFLRAKIPRNIKRIFRAIYRLAM